MKLSLRYQILMPIIITSALTAAAVYLYFSNLYEETKIQELVSRARATVYQAEAARNYAAEQFEHNVFRTDLTSTEDILHTVPIFSAIRLLEQGSKELNYTLRVPKNNPRNPDNAPNEYEKSILAVLESGTKDEYWEINPKTNSVHYFKAIKLTEQCLQCHGDPSKSMEYWGRSDGKDVTGTVMEGWKAGEVHGAFEIIQPIAPVMAEVSSTSRSILLLSSFGGLLLIAIGTFIAQRVGKPIVALRANAETIAKGDLDITIAVDREDELGDLARSFDTMVSGLRRNQSEIQRLGEIVDENNIHYSEIIRQIGEGNLSTTIATDSGSESQRKLAESLEYMCTMLNEVIGNILTLSSNVASSTDVIASSTEEISGNYKEQAMQVQSIAAATQEMSQTLMDMANSVNEVVSISDKTVQIAEQGNHAVKDSIQGMHNIAEVVTKTTSAITELGEYSARIGTVVGVIEDIADQTNLLALNAAIEAARAGESGRGFAVVADEVRKLAERTQKATKEIATTVAYIQEQTTIAVKSAVHGAQEVEKGRVLSVQAGKALAHIIEGITSLQGYISQIAASSEEQSVTAQEVARGIEHIAQTVDENSIGIDSIAKSTSELASQAQDLQSSVEHFALADKPNRVAQHKNVKSIGTHRNTSSRIDTAPHSRRLRS